MGRSFVGGATGRDSLSFELSPLKGKQQLFPLRMPSLKNSCLSLPSSPYAPLQWEGSAARDLLWEAPLWEGPVAPPTVERPIQEQALAAGR